MIPRSFGTHDGTFHADDVSACALLFVFDQIDREQIYRTRDESVLAECEYVCDVGGVYDPSIKRFDHHQNSYSGSLSSAGMILQYLRDQKVMSLALYQYLNNGMIIGIDAHDNGIVMQEDGVCTLSHVIAGMVPLGYRADAALYMKAFLEAVDFASGHFRRAIERFHYIDSCKDAVAASMAPREKVLFFDEAMPWQESFFALGGEDHPALFIVMPAQDHWKLRGIPPSPMDKMGVRMPLPADWAGLRGEELANASGVKGAIFCHKGLFISVWETKEAALKALEKVLKS